MIGSESHEKRMRAPSSKNECPKRKEREASDMRDPNNSIHGFSRICDQELVSGTRQHKQDRYSHWPSG